MAPKLGIQISYDKMSWDEVVTYLAQAAINIDEGITTIEQGSKVHIALHEFCRHLNEKNIKVKRGE
jgi:hypothetical protein